MNAPGIAQFDARRIEEASLNATGPFQSVVYDGWLLGYRPGRAKRLRCINAFYGSVLPLAQKLEYCARFYEAASLVALFRVSPFCVPDALDAVLDGAGWRRFESTTVMRVVLPLQATPVVPDVQVQLMPAPAWLTRTAGLLAADPAEIDELAARSTMYPLPQVGAIACRDDEIVAAGMMRAEGDLAGLYLLATTQNLRGQGLGRIIVAALLGEAARIGARSAYLQVTSANTAARRLYSRFGFIDAYDYWYRSRSGEDR